MVVMFCSLEFLLGFLKLKLGLVDMFDRMVECVVRLGEIGLAFSTF
jgi:hypothetical protein